MLLTRQQARDLDRLVMEQYGVPGVVLMENAGRGMAELLLSLGVRGEVVVCCGKGNNGGDGFVIARHLDNRGVGVRVLLFAGPGEITGDAGINLPILVKSGVRVDAPFDAANVPAALKDADWVVDALFGTGLTSAPRSPFDAVIGAINASGKQVLAV